jgi:hypothetical protein
MLKLKGLPIYPGKSVAFVELLKISIADMLQVLLFFLLITGRKVEVHNTYFKLSKTDFIENTLELIMSHLQLFALREGQRKEANIPISRDISRIMWQESKEEEGR